MTTAAIAQPRSTALPRALPAHRLAYFATTLISAFLLFQVQMIVGKYLLPWFGGTPFVWTTCMLFFQVVLLAGYAYAHVLSARLEARTQATVHLALLAIAAFAVVAFAILWQSPLTPPVSWRPEPGQNPIAVILGILTVSVGLPFFALSSTGPLMQRWFSENNVGDDRATYRLYSLSNLGSLAGLLSYPFAIERLLPVREQAWMWSAGFAAFVIVCGTVAALRCSDPRYGLGNGARLRASLTWGRRASSSKGSGVATRPFDASEQRGSAPTLRCYALWLALAACGSALLLATTNLLCQEIAVTPLLWVLPLAIYLISFIVCFDHERWYQRGWWFVAYVFACIMALRTLFAGISASLAHQIGWLCAALLATVMLCHGELAKTKPQARYLTRFYLLIAAGGALGGILIVIVAPLVLRSFADFQIMLLSSGVVALLNLWSDRASWLHRSPSWLPAIAVLGAAALPTIAVLAPTPLWLLVPTNVAYRAVLAFAAAWAAWALLRKSARPAVAAWVAAAFLVPLGLFAYAGFDYTHAQMRACVRCERNFFGVKRVVNEGPRLALINGRVRHGEQYTAAPMHMEPTTYYARDTGSGLLLANFPRTPDHPALDIGVVGLGAGTLAAYGKPGDHFRFYEIDPAVTQMSQGSAPVFSFLRDSSATSEIIVGDGRLLLEREAGNPSAMKFDVLVLDAFSSDAVPVHLLTREAMALYLSRLRGPQSVMAFHISNRAVDLKPVLLNLAQHYALASCAVKNQNGTEWVLLARTPSALALPNLEAASRPLASSRRIPLWTDDFSNLFDVLRR